MLLRHYLLFSSLALLGSLTGYAQEAPKPGPPYVGELSGSFSLDKKFTYVADASLTPQQQAAQEALNPASAKPAEVHTIGNRTLRKDIEIFANGSSREIWRVDTYRMSTYSAHPDSVIIDVASTGPFNPQAQYQYHDAADFPELAWIGDGMYQGIQMQQGKKCYAYKSGDQTAWISVEQKLPVYFVSKAMQVTYTYSDAPDEPLQLPKGYAEKLAKFKRAARGQM